MCKELIISKELTERFKKEVKDKYPKKAFGYFLSSKPGGQPDDFVMFNNDVRNKWKDNFEEYGNYYVRNEDARFLSTEEEIYEMNQKIKEMKKYIVGVYHSHQRHPAIFSTVDVDLHPSEKLWHLIISLRNFDMPQIKAFHINNGIVSEMKSVMPEV